MEWKHVGPSTENPYHCEYIPITSVNFKWGVKVVFRVERAGGGWVAKYQKVNNNGSLASPVCMLSSGCSSGLFLGFDTAAPVMIWEYYQFGVAPCAYDLGYGSIPISGPYTEHAFRYQATQGGPWTVINEVASLLIDNPSELDDYGTDFDYYPPGGGGSGQESNHGYWVFDRWPPPDSTCTSDPV